MLVRVHTGTLVGIDAHPVFVEANFVKGLPGFDVIGLPEAAVRESRVRVKAALDANGFELPKRRILINLAPGDVRKTGSSFDLAIAIAVLAACGRCAAERLKNTLVVGELSLDGQIRPVPGVLSQLRSAIDRGLSSAIIPEANGEEASIVRAFEPKVARHLREAVGFLDGHQDLPAPQARTYQLNALEDMADLQGQPMVRRALEVAAAGEHHLLMLGPPGAGKSMAAKRLGTLLPAPTGQEALEIATIASASSSTCPGLRRGKARPFRAPHHQSSASAIIGGGQPIHPGEVTLAHRGVLFLDELAEFRRDAIEGLRVTMEEGEVLVSRARERLRLPASSLVIAAMNPCPCGHQGNPKRDCVCSDEQVARYRARLSGPLLDRFDIQLLVPPVDTRLLCSSKKQESSAQIRSRVQSARQRLREDWSDIHAPADLATRCEPAALDMLDRASKRLALSARGYIKALRLGRTIAAMDNSKRIARRHLAEAIQYRVLDRKSA